MEVGSVFVRTSSAVEHPVCEVVQLVGGSGSVQNACNCFHISALFLGTFHGA